MTINSAIADVNRRAALKRGADYIREGRLHAPAWEEFWEMRKRPRFWEMDEEA